MNSNGRVFLVNPSGILFGSGSQINVNSLFASTLGITDSNFLLGNYVFENNGAPKSITNQGLLKGVDSINLFAGAINNAGSIEAPVVNLAVGDKLTASLGGGINVDVVVNNELKQNVNGLNDAINNSGSIKGTLISLKTNLENGIYENAVNNTGLVSASSMLDILGQTQNTIQETQTITETVANDNGTPNDPTDDFNEQVQKQVLVDKIVTSTDGTVKNLSTLEGGNLKIEAGVLENNPNAIIESTIGNLDIKLSGSKTALVAPLDNTLVHNGSSPPTQRAFGYTYKEISPPYTFEKIKQPGIVRINGKYYIQTPILNETINYSLLNKGTIQSANDLSITSTKGPIINRSGSNWNASLIAANDINLDAPNISNQRGGFYTTYRYEQLWIGSAPHDFEYWTDREPGTNAFILSGNDLNIKSSNFTNQAGSVEVGNNLNFNTSPDVPKNGNFSNISKILQETKHEHWVRRRWPNKKDHRNLWWSYSIDSPAADLYIEYDLNLGTSTNPMNNFTNTGLIDVGNFNAFGSGNFVNGITDRNIQNPSNFIPGTIQAERVRVNAEIYDIPIGYFLNTGLIQGTKQVVIKAQKIENIKRTAIVSKNIKRYKGLFSASRFEQVFYDSIQSRGEIKGGKIFLASADEFLNKGGLIKADTLLSIKANKITNTVQEGSEIVTWDPGNLGKILGIKNWGLKSVYEPGILASDGEIVLTAQNSSNGGSIFNIGSDIIAKGDVTIKADKLVEQNWVASHYTSSNSVKLKGLKVTQNKETAHVTRSSTIASTEGNVNIEVGNESTDGTFKNTASDVLANKNINISAKNIEISDAIHQSTDTHSQYGLLSYEAPTKFSVGGIETKNTKTTQQSSNFVAGNDINLGPPELVSGPTSISITGSNLVAGNKISLDANNINIKNGEYTNTIEQKGFEFGAGWTFTNPIGDIHATAWNLDGSQKVLTPSNLLANEILINSQNTNLTASNLNANNSIQINTNTFNSNGNFQTADSKVNFAGLSVTPAIQGVSVNLTAGKSNTNSGEYVFANINAPNVSINANNSNVQGTIINGQSINAPSETSYSNTNTSSIGASFNPVTGFGGITYSQTENGKGFFGGIGTNGLFGGFINGDWALGSNLGPPGQSTSATLTPFISNAQYGSTFSTTLGFTQGSSSHFFIAPNFNYQGLFNAGAAFQGGQLVGISYTTPLGSINEVFTPFQYTCFPKRTRIRVRRKKNSISGDEEEYEELDLEIEKIKIDDEVLSWNEQTEKLEWKFVLDTYIRKNNKLIVIQLVNGTIIKATPEHPFFVEGSWINASELKEGMKLLSRELNKVLILSINEEILSNEIDVFNLNVQDNHNYFAENILVHNNYVQGDAQETNNQISQVESQKLPMTVLAGEVRSDVVIVEEPISVPEHSKIDDYSKSLSVLINLAQQNSNLSSTQQLAIVSQLKNLQKQIDNAKSKQEVINVQSKVSQIELLIQFAQSKKALDSGFVADEANKNLKAAEGTIKEIKKQITDEKQKKAFDEIANKVFWEQVGVTGAHWLKSLGKAVDDWSITNKIEDFVTDNLKSIIKTTQEAYVKDELLKLEKNKKEMLELGASEVTRVNSRGLVDGKTIYGNPENDPPVVFIQEQKYRLQHFLDDKPSTYKERIDQEVTEYNKEYELIKAMPEGDKKTQAAQDFWNRLTSDIENSATKGLKWTHLERQQAKSKTQAGEPPYYAKEYDEYIGENAAAMSEYFKQYEISRGGDLGPDPKTLGRLETAVKDKINMKEFSKYLTDKETGLSWYAGMLSPIPLENNSNLSLGASEGSRFFNKEGFFRSHDGMDFATAGGTQTVSTLNGRFEHDQNNGVLKIFTDDEKYKVVYMHMPPNSFVDINDDGRVNVGDNLGKVGGWGYVKGVGYSNSAYPPHLHYEVWENRPIKTTNSQGEVLYKPFYVPIDPRKVDLSSYQTK